MGAGRGNIAELTDGFTFAFDLFYKMCRSIVAWIDVFIDIDVNVIKSMAKTGKF